MNISDFITLTSTNSQSIMEELRQARLEYRRETSTDIPPRVSRQERLLNQLDPRVREELLTYSISQRFRRQNIVRVCVRIGIPPSQTIRTLGSLVVN